MIVEWIPELYVRLVGLVGTMVATDDLLLPALEPGVYVEAVDIPAIVSGMTVPDDPRLEPLRELLPLVSAGLELEAFDARRDVTSRALPRLRARAEVAVCSRGECEPRWEDDEKD